jgi:hypothetical protein
MAFSKYGAKAHTVDGKRFSSKSEAERYLELKILLRAGEIRNLLFQVPIMLEGKNGPIFSRSGRQMRLTVDFVYEDKRLNWATVWEDRKGYATRDYDVRKGVAEAMGYKIKET